MQGLNLENAMCPYCFVPSLVTFLNLALVYYIPFKTQVLSHKFAVISHVTAESYDSLMIVT